MTAKLAFLPLLLLAGCKEYQTPQERYCLPPTARDIKDYGAGWHTFQIVIDGQTRTIWRHYDDRRGPVVESMTELQPR